MGDSERRPTIRVDAATGGWPHPWPNVAELAAVLPGNQWTLVGGLMVQLHSVHSGVGVVRATNDVDIVLHIETARGVPNRAATALESLGYRLLPAVDPRSQLAHRFVRGVQKVDVNGGQSPDDEQVDVLRADHPSPRVVEPMRGRRMVMIDGGTQALRRTVNAILTIGDAEVTISVPRPFAAVVLKASAYRSDSRDPDRHLFDAAALLACIEDPFVEADAMAGSDRSRIATLVRRLPDEHPAWGSLSQYHRANARAALRILGQA